MTQLHDRYVMMMTMMMMMMVVVVVDCLYNDALQS
jgi:hypothetical protein